MEPRSFSSCPLKPNESHKTQSGGATSSEGSGFQQLRDVFSETNPRKRPYRPDSMTIQSAINGENYIKQQELVGNKEDNCKPSPKRNRVTEWPLINATEPVHDEAGGASPSTAKAKKGSNGRRSGKKTTSRPSKFHEGSLNDKPSKQPPDAFLGAEDAMERYHGKQGAGSDGANMLSDAGNDASRPSTIFRFGKFGKAVANVFNGFWKEKEPPAVPLKDTIPDDRKAKAEDAYALLKQNGFKGTRSVTKNDDRELPGEKSIKGQKVQRSSFRDSAIDIVESQRPSLQTSRVSCDELKPPSVEMTKRSVSPGLEVKPGRRSSSLHLRTPSFQSLKKAKSNIHIPSIKRPADISPLLPASNASGEVAISSATSPLRRQPSKKDLAKYQRLSKKVSDLESKLDLARRDLQKSMDNAPPVPELPAHHMRKPFTPGTLASLPSERLLIHQNTAANVPHTNTEIYGPAIVSSGSRQLSSPSRQLGHELNNSFNEYAASNSRRLEAMMSSDPIAKPDIHVVDHASSVTATAAKDRRKLSRRNVEQQRSIEGKFPSGVKKRRSTTTPKAPKNSPAREGENVPPIPSIQITSRTSSNSLRPASPFLARPGVVSPVRTRSKSKPCNSPLPSSSSSALKRKARFEIHDDKNDTALTHSPVAGDGQKQHAMKGSPAPKAVRMKATKAKEMRKDKDKPLPEIQRSQGEQREKVEEFEWDEDVF